MPFYYLLPGLSGQQADMAAGKLSFNPASVPAGSPFSFPWFLASTVGTVAVDAGGLCTFTVAFGSLKLPAGGLSVNGQAYASAVDLTAGQSISWNLPTGSTA